MSSAAVGSEQERLEGRDLLQWGWFAQSLEASGYCISAAPCPAPEALLSSKEHLAPVFKGPKANSTASGKAPLNSQLHI